MICNICKDKVATIRLKEIIDNVVTELRLCQACFEAHEQEGSASTSASLSKMIDSLAGVGQTKTADPAESLKCPACGTAAERFRTKGRLGCAECYRALAVAVEPILSRVHGSTEHRGKVPHSKAAGSLDLKHEMRRLQEELESAIQSESYERAAKLRDRLKQLENV